jgi:D-3-phosphoglycerate dehydrogenase / 2-oxoglutarate reductase
VADVLVLEGVAGPAIDRLRDGFEVERATTLSDAQRLDDVRALIVRNATRVDATTLSDLPKLQVIGRAGVGLDNIDVASARDQGVTVTYAPGASTVSTAEHTLALALAVGHRVCELDRVVRQGGWNRSFVAELSGTSWGVIGFGRIGCRVAELARGIGMTVAAYDPAIDPQILREAGVRPTDLDELVASVRVLSMHVPLSKLTWHLVGPSMLSQMQPEAIVINTARGGLIDEQALASALQAGQLAGAGLDVRETEPPPVPDPLARLPQIVLTPHVAALSETAQDRVTQAVAADVEAVLEGSRPRFEAVP